jgi:hypothetical protein
MQWKLFKDETPELGKLILFGNHRYCKTMIFTDTNQLEEKMCFIPVTHWCYIDMPPNIFHKNKILQDENG